MKNIVTLILSLALIATQASAAPTVKERSDDHIFMNVGLGVGVTSSGLGDGGSSIAALATLGYRITPTVGVSLEFSGLDGGGTSWDATTISSRITASGSWMMGYNFILKGGIGHRSTQKQPSLSASIGNLVTGVVGVVLCGDEPDCTIEADSEITKVDDIGLELGLASEWQWGSFTFGVEWASIYQPVALINQSRTTETNKGTVKTDPGFDLGDLPFDARLLTLNIGASF